MSATKLWMLLAAIAVIGLFDATVALGDGGNAESEQVAPRCRELGIAQLLEPARTNGSPSRYIAALESEPAWDDTRLFLSEVSETTGSDTPQPYGDQAEGAAAGGDDAGELAKKTQNPVADLISLPLQNNALFGVGSKNRVQYLLNVQPVIPMNLNEDWNWIHRFIIPITAQPELAPGGFGEACGLGDIQYQGYLSPAKPGKLIWGVGPILQFPTATEDVLGTEKWSMGPGAVVLYMDGPWVCGALVSNIWSVCGDGDRQDVNLMSIQPIINYNLPDGWYLSSTPIITANWEADGGNTWTVPLGGGVGKIVRIGKLPVNIKGQAFYHVERPDGAADWALQLQFQFLFPKGS